MPSLGVHSGLKQQPHVEDLETIQLDDFKYSVRKLSELEYKLLHWHELNSEYVLRQISLLHQKPLGMSRTTF